MQRIRNMVILFLPCLFLAAMLYLQGKALPASSTAIIPASADNWGLSFPNEGQSPVGIATVEDLAQYDAWYLGDTSD